MTQEQINERNNQMKAHLKDLVSKSEESNIDYYMSMFSFFKGITTICTGLLGVLIAFKSKSIHANPYTNVLFLVSISLIGLCILFSLVVQFYEVIWKSRIDDTRKLQVSKYISDPVSNSDQCDSIKEPVLLKFSQVLAFSCLTLAILSLILYSCSIDFNLIGCLLEEYR